MADILAFDFGARRLGVAVGNDDSGQVSPLEVIETGARRPDWQRIRTLVERWQPQQMLVGLPLHMDGSESPLCADARQFAAQLQRRFAVPVQLHDERLSTREARELGMDAGLRGPVDALAACVVLHSWLAARD